MSKHLDRLQQEAEQMLGEKVLGIAGFESKAERRGQEAGLIGGSALGSIVGHSHLLPGVVGAAAGMAAGTEIGAKTGGDPAHAAIAVTDDRLVLFSMKDMGEHLGEIVHEWKRSDVNVVASEHMGRVHLYVTADDGKTHEYLGESWGAGHADDVAKYFDQ